MKIIFILLLFITKIIFFHHYLKAQDSRLQPINNVCLNDIITRVDDPK